VSTLNWPVVKLADVFPFTAKPRGLRVAQYSRIPFIPMNLVPFGGALCTDFVMVEASSLSSGTYIEPGDLLVAKITPSFENGKQGIVGELPTPFGYATTEVIPIQDTPGVSDRHYLSYYLLREDIRAELAGKMQGTTGRQRLDKTALANLKIPLPPLPEQRAIARVLQSVQAAREARQHEMALLDQLFRALLEELMTGRLPAAGVSEHNG
jgi:type I restriction enzyme S subunit